MADKGQHLDLSSDTAPSTGRAAGSASSDQGKHAASGKFLGVHFICCDIYARIYPNREQTAYEGRCPRCGKRIEFPIGEGGTDARFFQAY